jgi:hypothetical protein
MRILKYFTIVLLVFSCEENSNNEKKVLIRQFYPVKETYNLSNDSYNLEYVKKDLEANEVLVLIEILKRRKREYYISNKGQVFIPTKSNLSRKEHYKGIELMISQELEFVMENNGDLSVLKNFHNIKKHDTP